MLWKCAFIFFFYAFSEANYKEKVNVTNNRPKSATLCLLDENKRAAVKLFSSLRQVLNPVQSEFSIECDLVLPLSISNTISFP